MDRSNRDSPVSAGEMMMMDTPPPSPSDVFSKSTPAGHMMMNKKMKRKYPVKRPSIKETSLSKNGASAAVKHFFSDFIPEQPSSTESESVEQNVSDDTDSGAMAPPLPPKRGPQSSLHKRASLKIARNKHEFHYNMNHNFRGCFMIFNYKTFHPKLNLKARYGTDKDAENLKKTAENLGFEFVRIFRDCTTEETKNWIRSVAQTCHEYYDCFACAILTHGEKNDTLYTYDGKLTLKDFTAPFEPHMCESLAGKPKLFFIQACRGRKLDDGHVTTYGNVDQVDAVGMMDAVDASPITIPRQADFLIAYSTAKDYYSWRNESNGSWFIQALCSAFNVYHRSMDLLQMLTVVNCMVSLDYQSSSANPHMDGKKQIPSITTQLTKIVNFRPKNVSNGGRRKTVVQNRIEREDTEEFEANGDHVTMSRRRHITRQTSTISQPQEDEEEIDQLEADLIKTNFFPVRSAAPSRHPPSTPREHLTLPVDPLPDIQLTQPTPTGSLTNPNASAGDEAFRPRVSSFSSPLEPHNRAIGSSGRHSFPGCTTHMHPTERGYLMETHFD